MNKTNTQMELKSNFSWGFISNVLIRAVMLFLAFNFILPLLFTADQMGKISFYNLVFPGRERLPFGENPQRAYNLSLYNLDAMFASLVLTAGKKPLDEYRVIVLGDSSVWGILLEPKETLTGFLNKMDLRTYENKRMRFYNLGYPTLSLTKDLMMLDEAVKYQPDMVIWLVTLESFPMDKQLTSPIVENNPQRVKTLFISNNLPLPFSDRDSNNTDFLSMSLISERRALADLIRLQIYGIMWGATGIDQVYPVNYDPAQRDFDNDITFHDWEPPLVKTDQLKFEFLAAGRKIASSIPILLVNEPILISTGENSDLRYDFYYPRWVYDQYREMINKYTKENGWYYLDAWDLITEDEFTNSAIHLTPTGSFDLADSIRIKIKGMNIKL